MLAAVISADAAAVVSPHSLSSVLFVAVGDHVVEVGGDQLPPLLPVHLAALYLVEEGCVEDVDVVDGLEEDV